MGGFLFCLPKKRKFKMQLVFQTIFVSSKHMQPLSIKVIKALTKMWLPLTCKWQEDLAFVRQSLLLCVSLVFPSCQLVRFDIEFCNKWIYTSTIQSLDSLLFTELTQTELLLRWIIRKFNTPSGLDLSPTNSRTIWKCLRENTEIEVFSFSKILFFRRLLFTPISLFNDCSGKYSFKIAQFSSLNFSSLGRS